MREGSENEEEGEKTHFLSEEYNSFSAYHYHHQLHCSERAKRRRGAACKEKIASLLVTFENLTEGPTAQFLDDLEATLQDLLILLQHAAGFRYLF